MQLFQLVSHLQIHEPSTHLRKYCKPLLRFSRNFGRNLDMTLFGGNGGIAALEFGKVCNSLSRRSSNSEYRFRMRMEPPYSRQHKRTVYFCHMLALRSFMERHTRRISTVMFQTTNAPMPVLFPLIITWSSMYTLLAQQALFFESPSSVLSCSVIAPAGMDSMEIFEKDLVCDWTQYGGELTGDVMGEESMSPPSSCSACDVVVVVLSPYLRVD